jgi:hypothetical protein
MPQPPRYFLSSVLLLCWLGILHSTLGHGQSAGTDRNGPIVFHTNARTVVVNVVVTGRNGQPIEALPQEDFLVAEDGHPQTIATFEEHIARPSVRAGVPQLPPNVFTNIPRVKPTDSVTVLLLDLLNTPPEDQRTVRDQMLKYVKGLQPGKPVAIFALGKRLRLVQEFTGDPALLAEALSRQNGGVSMLKPEGETVADQQTLNEPGEAKEPGLIGCVGSVPCPGSGVANGVANGRPSQCNSRGFARARAISHCCFRAQKCHVGVSCIPAGHPSRSQSQYSLLQFIFGGAQL